MEKPIKKRVNGTVLSKSNHAGINREILLTLVFLVSAALLFGGVLFMRHVEHYAVRSRLEFLQQGNRLAAEKLARPGYSLSGPELQVLAEELSVLDWGLYTPRFRVVDRLAFAEAGPVARGRLVEAPTGQTAVLDLVWPGLLPILMHTHISPRVTIISPLVSDGEKRGYLVGIFSLAPVAAQLADASRWVFAYTLLYGTVLALVGYILLRRNVIAPVRNLVEAAEKVAGGDFESHVPERGPREIAGLARRFNEMVETLKASRRLTETHIEKLREANRQLQQTRDDLVRSEKLATVGHLAAGMAHELGNPLAALMGFLAVLEEDIEGPEGRKIACSARQEAERIDRLVRDLLDFATPASSQMAVAEPWPVICRTVEMLTAQGALKRNPVRLQKGCDPPRVRIDPARLEQVLVNLLLNARDASLGGQPIEISVKLSANHVLVLVRDFGCGIDSVNLQRIFEPFYTTKDPGKGRGLGLAVCQRILTDAGGQLRVESRPGQGSLFTVVLPVAEDEERGEPL